MTVTSAAPQFILNGIQDLSGREVGPVQEELPQHLPYVHLFTERGPETVELAAGADLTRIYGAKSFDYRSKYANHATVLANTINAEGNSLMVRRITAADAKKARLRLCLETVPSELTVWNRNPDGTYELDINGDRVSSGATAPGVLARWIVKEIPDGELVGSGVVMAGDLVGSDPMIPSVVRPIMDLPASHKGMYGDNIGFRFYAPTLNSSIAVDDEVILDQEAYLYRLQFVERPDAKSSPVTTRTLSGGQFVEFSFKDGVINKKVDAELSFGKLLPSSYRAVDPTSGLPPVYGPCDELHLYKDNVEAALIEVGSAIEGVAVEDGHIYNFVGGVDVDGIPYDNFELVGPAQGGILLTEGATHYLKGGADGTLDNDTFDTLVGNSVANFENDELDLMDDAKYPFSVIYDSGFSIETKKKLLTPIGLRKDVYVVLSTQTDGEPANTASADSSMGVALRAAARMYPESVLYGTACCRAVIIPQAGYLTNSNYDKLVPQVIDFAQKQARFMGQGNGEMRAGAGYDIAGNNHVSLLNNLNNTYKRTRVRNKDWAAGLSWSETYNRRSFFYPGFQTVYDDDTSILNSTINMAIAVELEKVCQRTWRDLTGNTQLTADEFVEHSNELIAKAVSNRFDNRVVIVPRTYYTEDDSKRGYSWSCEVNMYGNNMKTVGSFTVTARRREDLE
jgi:hypothetical protein